VRCEAQGRAREAGSARGVGARGTRRFRPGGNVKILFDNGSVRAGPQVQ
jgi:hypothetical protein